MSGTFNENTRVKIPAILHLARLGFDYISLKKLKDYDLDPTTNIFKKIFFDSIIKINPSHTLENSDLKKLYDDISLKLDYDDLGQDFYKMLIHNHIKLIDFENFENNTFNVVTELTYKKDEDEFRPDITILVNGMPLAFIEVKKPHNKDGILAERDRINIRFQNKKFKKFINITQILVFSNNMEYEESSVEQLQGAFYSSTTKSKAIFNAFKEDETVEKLDLDKILKDENDEIINFVLKDLNSQIIKENDEFITNKNPNSPTNRILTSIFSKERFSKFLKYSIAYVKDEERGVQKHIMRYPQFFAMKAIEKSLNRDVRKGVIWHTQGSGKTALSYYAVKFLIDYYQSKNIIPRFYFIVDRIDLLKQANTEFNNRGLSVINIDSKEELTNDFQKSGALVGIDGRPEITVVNIHKFEENTEKIAEKGFNLNVQRIYFLDEVHRSYNPRGSFLANLISSDRKAIIIGLTGTPIIDREYNTKDIFGDYIHKYYYNQSISDGYTLRLIREEISTEYKLVLQKAVEDIQIKRGVLKTADIYSHQVFVEPLLEYIINDFQRSRNNFTNQSEEEPIGGMIVCQSSPQAEKLFDLFNSKYQETGFKASLILNDFEDKEYRDSEIKSFKAGKIDLLIVYNMLLTGFDAPRLKKLYLGRVVKSHNLLQTLTRVNRPFRNFKFGYVVDFADIRREFDMTNRAYLEELNSELGDEIKSYSNIFLSKEEVEKEVNRIENVLYDFDIENAEIFSQQISQINDKKELYEIRESLQSAREMFNVIKLMGYEDLINKINFEKLASLYNETDHRIKLINVRDSLSDRTQATNLLNTALEEIIFTFTKTNEEELKIVDEFSNILRKTREELSDNIDKDDEEFVNLYDELRRIFENKNLEQISQEELKRNITSLNRIHEAIKELNRKNNLLKVKFENDEKYVRVFKKVIKTESEFRNQPKNLLEALKSVKEETDGKISNMRSVIKNEGFFNQLMNNVVIDNFEKKGFKLDFPSANKISQLTTKEYLQQFNNN